MQVRKVGGVLEIEETIATLVFENEEIEMKDAGSREYLFFFVIIMSMVWLSFLSWFTTSESLILLAHACNRINHLVKGH